MDYFVLAWETMLLEVTIVSSVLPIDDHFFVLQLFGEGYVCSSNKQKPRVSNSTVKKQKQFGSEHIVEKQKFFFQKEISDGKQTK